MARRSIGLVTLGAALVLGGCAAKVPYNPFKVDRAEFYPRLMVVALAPMGAPRDFEDPTSATDRFMRLMEVQLRDAGLTLIPADTSRALWDSLTAEVGGYFDPATGEVDEPKLRMLRGRLYRALRARHDVDAMLFSSLVVVGAELKSDRASWDGTSQGAGKGKFWKALLGVSHSGTIPALSLRVVLSDTADTDLYVNAGGIELLAKVSTSGFVDVPRHELFLNDERNVKAVTLALGPLLGRTAGGRTASR